MDFLDALKDALGIGKDSDNHDDGTHGHCGEEPPTEAASSDE